MIYRYKELKKIFGGDYQIKNALKTKKIFKIDVGIYSDIEYPNNLEVITKKYPDAIFTLDSAFYFHNLTDVIPKKINLATKRNALRMQNDKISQSFIKDDLFETGKTTINIENTEIPVYDKERMLIELIRNKKHTAFDYYKEIINNYRKIINELDTYKLQEYIEKFPNDEYIYNTIQMEVF